jgi:uncharacterized protein (DUF1330 family)
MPTAYWISWYRTISNPGALSEYAKIAVPALEAHGGRTIVRGHPAKIFEGGTSERTVIIEFDSVDEALAEAYQAARKKLQGAVEREIRIVEGL